MTGQEIITKLQSNGFALFVDGDRLAYRYELDGEPDPGKVIPLLESLKQNKAIVLTQLKKPEAKEKKKSEYQVIFEQAVNEMVFLDPHGLGIKFIKGESPDLWTTIQEKEDEINRIWLKAQTGQDVVDGFKEAVSKWQRFIKNGLEVFNRPEGHTVESGSTIYG